MTIDELEREVLNAFSTPPVYHSINSWPNPAGAKEIRRAEIGVYAYRFQSALARRAEFINGWLYSGLHPGSTASFNSTNASLAIAGLISDGMPTRDAIEWVLRLAQGEVVEGLHIATLWGVTSSTQIAFGNGVSIVPFCQVPDSDMKRSVVRDSEGGNGTIGLPAFLRTAPPAALVKEIQTSLIRTVNAPDPKSAIVLTEFEATRLALTLVGPSAAFVSTSWFEYPDQRLIHLDEGASKGTRAPDVFPYEFPSGITILPADVKTVDLFVTASLDFQKVFQVPLHFLNQAMMRQPLWGPVTDLPIVIECCLYQVHCRGSQSAKSNTEKVVKLLGNEFDVDRVRQIIDGLYKARNKLMHLGELLINHRLSDGAPIRIDDLVKEARIYCAAVVRRALEIKRGSAL